MDRIIGLLLVFNFVFCSAYPFNERLTDDLDEINSHWESNELYFDQKLDHLDPENRETWPQRYWHNDSCYKNSKETRIALLFVHNAFTFTELDTMDEKLLNPLAEDLNATRFYLEHRFYGKSKPKNDTTVESLRYLSSEQALADIANFITKVSDKHRYLAQDKVIWLMFGVSYGGSLATWARYKYPNLIDSAIAINAPLLAKVDFEEYFENVANLVNSHNPTCGEKIASANQELKELTKSGENSEKLIEMFDLCENSTQNADDLSSLFSELAQNFAHAVDFSGIVIKSKKRTSVQRLCDTMLKSGASPLESYAKVNRLNLRNRKDPERGCFDFGYNKKMKTWRKTDYDVAIKDRRQWIYQTCTEFGFFATSSKASQMFGNNFPATFFAKQCQDLFGPEFNMEKIKDGVSKTNKKYGGLEINVNRTIFIYYSENPWRSLFITQNKTYFYDVIKIDINFYNQKLKSRIPNVPFISFSWDWNDWKTFAYKLEKTMGCVLNAGDGCAAPDHHHRHISK